MGWNVFRSNFGRLPRPYKLTFAVTYNCNSRCVTCGIWKTKPVNELSTGEIQSFFERNPYFNWVDLTGGEIFLRGDIEEVFDIVIKYSPRLYTLHFPTNGLLPDKIEGVARYVAPKVARKFIATVSLDGPPAIHDEIRGVPGGWGKALETFKRLSGIPGVEVYFGMTLAKDNIGRVDDTIDSVRKEIPSITPRDFHLNIAHTSTNYYQNTGEVEYPKDAAARDVEEFRRKKGFKLNPVFYLEQKYMSLVPEYLSSEKTPLPCKAASVSCFIDPQGTVYPCTMWDKPLGNLRDVDYDLHRLWNTSEFRQTARDALKKKCPNCWTPCEAYQTILGNIRYSF